MQTSSSKALALAAAAVLLMAAGKKPNPYEPSFAAPPPPVAPANGSIFQASRGYAPLTSGTRASMVGDLVTIVLVERTQAAKTSVASTGRDADIGLAPPVSGPLALFTPQEFNMGGSSKFDGKGQAAQSNTLSGEISVTIAEVYPNGTMLVRGEKQIKLNRGDEFVRISGIIRQVDVTADNRVPSTRVADADITYSGKGEIARASRQGWLQRFFSIVTPF
ncbi:MAG TPA: flagellar basal body L-ring protein FlgH [Sphingomicrobium sp.]|nr:flagellar basal body L-ring protein FlgH [Sphingomicrobium sp.]